MPLTRTDRQGIGQSRHTAVLSGRGRQESSLPLSPCSGGCLTSSGSRSRSAGEHSLRVRAMKAWWHSAADVLPSECSPKWLRAQAPPALARHERLLVQALARCLAGCAHPASSPANQCRATAATVSLRLPARPGNRLASNPSRAPAQRRRHRHGARRKVQTIPSRHRLRCAVAASCTPISTNESRSRGRAALRH